MSATAANPSAPIDPTAAVPPATAVATSVPSTSVVAPITPALTAEGITRTPMSRLTAIEIRNYRAYRGTFRLELPKGENLLVYGENGAGKSSLFHTLRTFLEAPGLRVVEATERNPNATRPIKITDYRHRFTSHEPGVRLEFGERKFDWMEGKNDTSHELVRLLNQAKGFLDYKALLEVHYLRAGEETQIDLFPLLMRSLLPYYTYAPPGGTSQSYSAGLAQLNAEAKRSWSPASRRIQKKDELAKLITAYNEALEKDVQELGTRASALLEIFGGDFHVSFRYVKAEYRTWPRRIEAPKVLAVPAFRRQQFPDYHHFFNEARLSGLAICLFFAALQKSPATGLRLLVLDDILIGLDMTNRVKVIDLVRDHFKDWQIILLTYSKAWFERLKDHVNAPDWKHRWKSVVLWEDWRDEDASPYIIAEGSGDLLEMAERHLTRKDYKAAAVYARSALEALCHHTCAKANLPVIHVTSSKERKVEHYIEGIEARLGQLRVKIDRQSATKLIARLREAQSFVLNRNSHFDVEEEDPLSGEVKAAIQTVRDLAKFFENLSWKKAGFDDCLTLTATEKLSVELAEARKVARFGPKENAVQQLSLAHHLAWEIYGTREQVALPLGSPINAKSIWTAALAQSKLEAALDTRLKAALPYLFGSVKAADFDAKQFEVTAKLLEELSAPPPAAPAALPAAPKRVGMT